MERDRSHSQGFFSFLSTFFALSCGKKRNRPVNLLHTKDLDANLEEFHEKQDSTPSVLGSTNSEKQGNQTSKGFTQGFTDQNQAGEDEDEEEDVFEEVEFEEEVQMMGKAHAPENPGV